ncbi:hypothetical protein GFY24_38770 [Nocardia sp. SYP-A9097]|nr:hypothetical protein [Nocardia sp. SYP-A9097]
MAPAEIGSTAEDSFDFGELVEQIADFGKWHARPCQHPDLHQPQHLTRPVPAIAAGATFRLDLAMTILSGPMYFQFLITQKPLTRDYVDRVYDMLLAGLRPRR